MGHVYVKPSFMPINIIIIIRVIIIIIIIIRVKFTLICKLCLLNTVVYHGLAMGIFSQCYLNILNKNLLILICDDNVILKFYWL